MAAIADIDRRDVLRKFSYKVKVSTSCYDSGNILMVKRGCLNIRCLVIKGFYIEKSPGKDLIINYEDTSRAILILEQGGILPEMQLPQGYYDACFCSTWQKQEYE